MNIKDNIRTIRIRMGLTQKQLGKRLRITQGAVSHWERGLTYPSISIASRFVKLAGKKGIYFSTEMIRAD